MTLSNETKIIKVTEVVAETKAAFGSVGAVFDKGELSFNINKASGKAWRLVHDGKNVITLIEGTDKDTTGTIHTIEEFSTEKLALKGIEAKKLIYENTIDTPGL